MGDVYVGVDAHRKGWVAIVLSLDGFVEAHTFALFSDLAESLTTAEVVAVDIPIGIDDSHPRQANLAARKFVGRRRSSVFLTPPMAVLKAPDYTAARRTARALFDIGVSAQAYALAPKILEVGEVARSDSRIIEIHPEVSFTAMAGSEIQLSKTTWNGQKTRERLLQEHGIRFPDDLAGTGGVKPDDVLDAAAAAWTALRYALNQANSLPSVGQLGDSSSAIWY